jgi:predicted small secreted protein
MIKRIVLLFLAVTAVVVSSTGCRTAHGAGEDIEKAGESTKRNT